jgi:hypothetical protein
MRVRDLERAEKRKVVPRQVTRRRDIAVSKSISARVGVTCESQKRWIARVKMKKIADNK